jgi:hypothetical protein
VTNAGHDFVYLRDFRRYGPEQFRRIALSVENNRQSRSTEILSVGKLRKESAHLSFSCRVETLESAETGPFGGIGVLATPVVVPRVPLYR